MALAKDAAFFKPGSWEEVAKVIDALINRGGYGIEVDLFVYGSGWTTSSKLWDTACCCYGNGVDWLRHVRIYDPNVRSYWDIENDERDSLKHSPCHTIVKADGDWDWEDDTPQTLRHDLALDSLRKHADSDAEYKDNVAVWRLFSLFVGVSF